MKIALRKFTTAGTQAFQELLIGDGQVLIRERPEEFLSKVSELVKNSELTVQLKGEIEVRPIVDRLEFAEHLWTSFKAIEEATGEAIDVSNKYFWDWLSAAWLETLVTSDAASSLAEKIGSSQDAARWILVEDKTRFHRHLVSGPYFAYEANFPNLEQAMILFTGTVLISGELWERIAGKTSLATGSVLYLATLMFYDSVNREIRPKAGAKDSSGVQAFSKYFSQIDLTTDYEGMSVEELLEILPPNLQKWAEGASTELERYKNRPLSAR